MSEFIKAARMIATGENAALRPRRFNPLKAAADVYSTESEIGKVYEYKVTWECKHTCRDNDVSSGYFFDLMEKQLREAVFGDFRADLMDLERAIFDDDDVKARSLIGSLLERTKN